MACLRLMFDLRKEPRHYKDNTIAKYKLEGFMPFLLYGFQKGIWAYGAYSTLCLVLWKAVSVAISEFSL